MRAPFEPWNDVRGRHLLRAHPRIAAAILSIVMVAISGAAASAQPPDLSGTWKLDEEASKIDPTVTYVGLGGNVGTPSMLYVTQAKNGTLIIGSNTNTSHARTYEPGAESVAPLGGGEVRMRSRWEGASLVAQGQDAASKSGLRETLTMSTDGQTFVVTITMTTETEKRSTTLIYTKTTDELPCEEWATPCRDWSDGGSSRTPR